MATWEKIKEHERQQPTDPEKRYQQSGMRRDLPASLDDQADLIRPDNRKIKPCESDDWGRPILRPNHKKNQPNGRIPAYISTEDNS